MPSGCPDRHFVHGWSVIVAPPGYRSVSFPGATPEFLILECLLHRNTATLLRKSAAGGILKGGRAVQGAVLVVASLRCSVSFYFAIHRNCFLREQFLSTSLKSASLVPFLPKQERYTFPRLSRNDKRIISYNKCSCSVRSQIRNSVRREVI